MKIIIKEVAVLLLLVIFMIGCGGNSARIEYKTELTAKLVINGVGPGGWELFVYKQGHAGDKLYLVASMPIVYEDYKETKPQIIGSFRLPIPEPGIYDIDLSGSAGIYKSWRDHHIDVPSSDLGIINVDYPVP